MNSITSQRSASMGPEGCDTWPERSAAKSWYRQSEESSCGGADSGSWGGRDDLIAEFSQMTQLGIFLTHVLLRALHYGSGSWRPTALASSNYAETCPSAVVQPSIWDRSDITLIAYFAYRLWLLSLSTGAHTDSTLLYGHNVVLVLTVFPTKAQGVERACYASGVMLVGFYVAICITYTVCKLCFPKIL